LPANLATSRNLSDIRGYDGVDPAQFIALLFTTAHPDSYRLSHAQIQAFVPAVQVTPSGTVQLSPIMDMLNVRYVVFRGAPPPNVKPAFSGFDYWAVKNDKALPRVYVPEHIETVADDGSRLKLLSAVGFDARQVAYVGSPIDLPATCHGSAWIEEETPLRIAVSFDMATSGLLVLADRYDVGWKAYLNGKQVPVLRTNHAIRGVVVPAGKGTVHFRYEPRSLAIGAKLAGVAVIIWVIWSGVVWRRTRLVN
jgi:hypothetical protein